VPLRSASASGAADCKPWTHFSAEMKLVEIQTQTALGLRRASFCGVKVALIMGAWLALGCGGRSLVSGEPRDSGGTTSVAPIDTTGLPTQLALHCPTVRVDQILNLPCKVGMPQVGSGASSLNAVVCTDQTGLVAFSMAFPLGELASELNQPLTIPFETAADLDPDPVLNSQWHGTAVFSQVDPEGRGFVGRLSDASAEFTVTSPPLQFTCDVPSAPFWGDAGDFQ
jgi:hypothetical protein